MSYEITLSRGKPSLRFSPSTNPRETVLLQILLCLTIYDFIIVLLYNKTFSFLVLEIVKPLVTGKEGSSWGGGVFVHVGS